MQRFSSSTLEFHTRPNSTGALIGSLLLLASSFTLLVLGPTLLGRFQGSADSLPAGNYLNIAAASGIALGGGAAMIAVVARLVRDIELRPYAVLGPVLSVFTGFVLWGLRAQLPLQGVPTEYVGVFALAVGVAGGALVAQRGSGTRPMGWVLAFFAPIVLLTMLWARSGHADPGAALTTLEQPVRMFMGVLAGASFVLCLLGEVARALRVRSPFPSDFVAMPRGRAGNESEDYVGRVLPTPKYGSQPVQEPGSLREAIGSTGTDWRDRPIPSTDAYLLQSQEFDQPRQYTPKGVSVWDFEDEQMALPTKHYALKGFVLLLLIVVGGGSAMYYGSILPNQQKEKAAQVVLQQHQAQVKAAEQQELAQKRADEAKAAAARLEELLKAPEAAGAAPASASAAGAPAGKAVATTAKPVPAAAAPSAAAPAALEGGKQAPNLEGASAIPPAAR